MNEKVNIANYFTPSERHAVSKVFQNYYCMGLIEIAGEYEEVKSLFLKIGLLDEEDFEE